MSLVLGFVGEVIIVTTELYDVRVQICRFGNV